MNDVTTTPNRQQVKIQDGKLIIFETYGSRCVEQVRRLSAMKERARTLAARRGTSN